MSGQISRISLAIFLVAASLGLNVSPTHAVASSAQSLGAQQGHSQFGAAASGSIVVWQDQSILQTTDNSLIPGSSNIVGFDFSKNQPFVVVSGAGDQTEPTISGSLVAWMDTSHSCPTCEADINAKNLQTDQEIAIATGPLDQAHPAIAGDTVAWVQSDGTHETLMGKNLANQQTITLASVSAPTTIGRPVASDNLIVWIEGGPKPPVTLKAYDLGTGQITTVTTTDYVGTQYGVSGNSIVWTDPRLWIDHVDTGTKSILDSTASASPQISGTTVLWSSRTDTTTPTYAIQGLDLQTDQRYSVVGSSASQLNPVLAGGQLIWQTNEANKSALFTTPLAQTVTGTTSQPATSAPSPSTAISTSPINTTSASSYTRPTFKGMHVANGGGWNVTYNGTQQPCTNAGCPAIDALGAPVQPFFGSFVVINYDLNRQTGRSSPWGPTVSNALSYVQSNFGSRVVVRTYPSVAPNTSGTTTPDSVAQQLISLAQSYSWIQHVQVNNEPNIEWPSSCNGCTWASGGQVRTYSWTGLFDYRLFQAINDFYSDAWWSIDYYKNNYGDPTVRSRLQQMQTWTPPMSDYYRTLDNGQNFYTYLHGMISLYGRLTYHTYPAPNYDADGSGGIVNNSWTWFDSWLQTNVTNGTVRSMITEFGWNPGQMPICNLTQYSSWPGSGAGSCSASDGYTHTFDHDVSRFLATQRHNAEVVAVWIIKGWSDRADGLDAYGNVRTWLHNYQWSSP